MKSLSSIINKVIDRNKSIFDIADLIRGALIFDEKKIMDSWIKDFKRKCPYITKYDFKEKGKDKVYGYFGTHHFDLHIDNYDVELIDSTKKLWNYKEEAHKLYSKWRSAKQEIPKADMELSKKLFSIGNIG